MYIRDFLNMENEKIRHCKDLLDSIKKDQVAGISSRVGESNKRIVEGRGSDYSWKNKFGTSIKIPKGIHTNIEAFNSTTNQQHKSSPYNSKIVIPDMQRKLSNSINSSKSFKVKSRPKIRQTKTRPAVDHNILEDPHQVLSPQEIKNQYSIFD